MSTSTTTNGTGEVYSVTNSDPIDAAERLGNWLYEAGISETSGVGKVLAFAAISRRIDVVEFACEHRVVDGRLMPSHAAETLDLSESGGRLTSTASAAASQVVTIDSAEHRGRRENVVAGTGECAETLKDHQPGGPSAGSPSPATSSAGKAGEQVLATNAQLDRIVTLGGRITNSDTGLPYTIGELAAQIHDLYGCEPNALPAEQADELIARFEAITGSRKTQTAA